MLFVGPWNDPNGTAFYANAVTISPSGTTGAKFYSNNGIGGVTLKSDGITFPDGTIQETAFNGTTSTNETIITWRCRHFIVFIVTQFLLNFVHSNNRSNIYIA
jgi:hypothetical protein